MLEPAVASLFSMLSVTRARSLRRQARICREGAALTPPALVAQL